MSDQMSEVEVTIRTADGELVTYSVMAPSTPRQMREVLSSTVELASALLGGSYRKDESSDGVDTRPVQ